MIVDILVFGLTLYNAVIRRKEQGVSTVTRLYNDGFFHFSTILLSRIFSILNTTLASPTIVLVGLLLSWMIVTVVLSRLIIRLRTSGNPYTWTTTSLSFRNPNPNTGSHQTNDEMLFNPETDAYTPTDKFTFNPYELTALPNSRHKHASSSAFGQHELKVIKEEEEEEPEVEPDSSTTDLDAFFTTQHEGYR